MSEDLLSHESVVRKYGDIAALFLLEIYNIVEFIYNLQKIDINIKKT